MYGVYRAGLEEEARNITRSVIESFDYIDRWMIQKQTNPLSEFTRKKKNIDSISPISPSPLLFYF